MMPALQINDDVELVDPERLASRQWCHRAQKTIGQGDICASYSADRFGMSEPVRKPFTWRGGMWILLRAEFSPETFQHVLQILLWNSLEWMRSNDRKKISILARVHDSCCKVLFQDSEPGIDPRYGERIFQPRFSLKENGRGMDW